MTALLTQAIRFVNDVQVESVGSTYRERLFYCHCHLFCNVPGVKIGTI